ncbi:MAG: C25 family cysteine peptidase [Ignavibacteriaceae bacterium]
MKTTFTFLILFLIGFSSSMISQNKIEKSGNGFSINISFDESYFNDTKNGILTIRDYSDFTDVSQSGKFKLPSSTFLIVIPQNSKPNISFTSLETEIIKNVIPVLQPKAKLINDSTLDYEQIDFSEAVIDNKPNSSIEVIGFVWYREFYCVQVKINSHQFNINSSEINRIKSGKLSVDFGSNYPFSFVENFNDSNKNLSEDLSRFILNYEMADQFTGRQPLVLEDTTGNWINYGLEYLKIGTAKDALFRITKADLEAKGINTTSINPKSFRLIESGIEIPVTVFGEDDNVFNDNDYIQFYGTLNYPEISHRVINNPDEPYNEYLDRYSDTTFYFLTWGVQDGKRINTQTTFASGLTDSLTYYNYLLHTESNRLFQNFYTDEVENQSPGWLRNKTWYYLQTVWLYSNTTRNYNFTVTDAIPNKTAKFFYKAVSGGSNITSNAHQVILKANGSLVDSQSIDRSQQLLLNGTLNTNQFITNPNVLSVKNYANGTNPNYLGIDWYDIEYPRLLKFNSDFLLFKVSDDISSGLKIVKISNATLSSYEIYKVKPYYKKIDNYQVSANQVLFTDTVRAGDQYIVVAPSKIGKPVFYYKKQFVNLRSVSTQADYIAVTHPKFLQNADNYVNTISTMYGISKDLVSVEDIFDEFGFGYPTPESVQLYSAVTYQNRIAPKPQYLTLIGDANYDYKLYRFKADGVKGGGNYVPGFGNPISDNWLAIWEPDSLPIPQMKVGRIPVNTNEELSYYLSKVQNNYDERFDEWNKKYLFFSGGRADQQGEIDQLKSVNDQVINNFVRPEPLSGSYKHFYKTSNPLSDFGPYTPEEISDAIDAGGVFISYLGHSGTATWDNSISETTQLKNNVNRNPLITDFGCSTNKFAEPDIISFGERFLLNNDGQALGYIGNSSLGFTTTSLTMPVYFYEDMFNSSTKEVGNAHLVSKIRMFQNIGTSSVFRLFSFTNTLIGDPAVRIKIPGQPNLQITSEDIILVDEIINDSKDSTEIKIVINNYGLKDSSQFNYQIQHSAGGNIIKTFSGRSDLPAYKDTISIWAAVENLAGENSLSISLDLNNEVSEIYEDDNTLTYSFYVYSTELRDLVKHRIENSNLSSVKILNPSLMESQNFNIKYQLSENGSFQNFQESTIAADSFKTELNFGSLTPNKRYWFRYKLDETNSESSETKSFYTSENGDFILIDSTSFNEQLNNYLGLQIGKLAISPKQDNISVTSAGYDIGRFCIISKNGINLLANTFFAGMGIVVFDDVTLEVDTSAWYQLFNNPTNMTALVNLIDSVPLGKIVAIGVATDAANNITSALKNAIKTLGSTMIDNLTFGKSWALIGKKGVAPGDVIELLKSSNELIYIDSTFTIPRTNGTMETIAIGPSTNWQSATVSQNIPGGSSIQHFAYGVKSDETIDSLGVLNFVNNNANLGFINPDIYPKIKIKSEFNATQEGISPELSSLAVDYVGLPELGTNYQVVGLDSDTIPAGGSVNLSFWVYNTGEANTDSFNVKVDVFNENNTSSTVLNQLITTLLPDSRRKFDINYVPTGTDNEKRFVISIDSDNKVSEYFEDNNFFTKSFYIQNDLTPPSLKITFDETEVINGDFVSSKPNIKIALSDESPIPIVDTTAIKIFLNEEPVYYGANPQNLSYVINSSNPKFVAEYNPELEDGEYLLRIVGKDPNGNAADSASSEVYFVVSSETKLLEVYNYPNPFANETYFTFRLSQIPDEVKIRIYTVAGRLIKEITKKASELNYDLNNVFWDGKDEDGDIIANGTYLYKMIMKDADKVESVTQKLVIVK